MGVGEQGGLKLGRRVGELNFPEVMSEAECNLELLLCKTERVAVIKAVGTNETVVVGREICKACSDLRTGCTEI